jgi:hypothetical protein
VKGIGVVVAVLLVGGGIATYVTTRPPDRTLESEERAWVEGFMEWQATMLRATDQARTAIGLTRGEELSPERIDALEDCSPSLEKLGPSPTLLEQALTDARTACGEIEYALSVYARYGAPSLASSELHLKRAWRFLQAAELNIERQLTGDTS